MNIESELRIGDAERDEAIAALAQHFAAGRITQEEYDERSDQALKARTRGQLTPLFADLPDSRGATQHTTPAATAPQQDRWRGWARMRGLPLVPIILVLIGISILAHFPFFLLLVFAWFFFAGPQHRHHQARQRDYRRHGSSQGQGRRW